MNVAKELIIAQTIITKALYVLGAVDMKKILTEEEVAMFPKVKEDEMFKLVMLEKGLEK